MERPYTYILALCSADAKTAPPLKVIKKGRDAYAEYLFKWVKDPMEVNRKTHQLRAQVDAILVGDRTILSDDSELTVRLGGNEKNPLRVVASNLGDIPQNAKVLNTEKAPTLIAVSKMAPEVNISHLKGKEVDVFICGEETVDMAELSKELYRRGVKKLLVEGGAMIRWAFFSQRLVDEYWVWITPALWGTEVGITKGEGFNIPDDVLELELKNQYILGGNVIGLEYRVIRKP